MENSLILTLLSNAPLFSGLPPDACTFEGAGAAELGTECPLFASGVLAAASRLA